MLPSPTSIFRLGMTVDACKGLAQFDDIDPDYVDFKQSGLQPRDLYQVQNIVGPDVKPLASYSSNDIRKINQPDDAATNLQDRSTEKEYRYIDQVPEEITYQKTFDGRSVAEEPSEQARDAVAKPKTAQ